MIIVDSNEQATSAETVERLREIYPKLVVGDCIADVAIPLTTGLLLIERKTLGDLLGSISDSRLWQQAARMAEASQFACIIVQGELRMSRNDKVLIQGKETGWHGASVRAALLAVQWAGCAVAFIAPGDYARTVEEVAKLAAKPSHFHYTRTSPSVSFYPEDKALYRRIDFIQAIPHVGPKRAEALVKWCDSGIAEILEWATRMSAIVPDKSHRPKGWTDNLVNKVRQFLDLSIGEYISIRRDDSDE